MPYTTHRNVIFNSQECYIKLVCMIQALSARTPCTSTEPEHGARARSTGTVVVGHAVYRTPTYECYLKLIYYITHEIYPSRSIGCRSIGPVSIHATHMVHVCQAYMQYVCCVYVKHTRNMYVVCMSSIHETCMSYVCKMYVSCYVNHSCTPGNAEITLLSTSVFCKKK